MPAHVLLAAGLLAASPLVVLLVLSLVSRTMHAPGPVDGRLADCSRAPNCACSQASSDRHRIAPLRFAGPADEATTRLVAILERLPRTRIIARRGPYLHAETTSRLFRFIDDVEFLLDPASHVIHMRSASRVGWSDGGVNRARLERIRREFERG